MYELGYEHAVSGSQPYDEFNKEYMEGYNAGLEEREVSDGYSFDQW